MKKLKVGKYRIKLIYLYILAGLLAVFVAYLIFFGNLKKESELKYSTSFLSVDPAWADTTLKYMSLEEKLGQLIFFEAGEINNNSKDSVLKILY